MSGFNYLKTVDKLVVKSKVSLIEFLIPVVEAPNQYVICDASGKQIWNVRESSNLLERNSYRGFRECDLAVMDINSTNIIINYHRPRGPGICLTKENVQTIETYAPPEKLIGSIKQVYQPCCGVCCCSCAPLPTFSVRDASENELFYMQPNGKCMWMTCFVDHKYTIFDDGDSEIGSITKIWERKSMYSDADTFVIIFPMNLPVNIKATILGAVFVIDLMFYEAKRAYPPTTMISLLTS